MRTFPVKHEWLRDSVVDLIPLRDKAKPGVTGFFEIVARFFQDLEDTIYSTVTNSLLSIATGRQLKIWGRLVGEEQDGLSTELYRSLIQTAFAARRSSGSRPDLIEMWRLAIPQHVYVDFRVYPKNHIVFTSWSYGWLPENYMRRVAGVVRSGCPIGSVGIREARLSFLGGDQRTVPPFPAEDPTTAYGAKVW